MGEKIQPSAWCLVIILGCCKSTVAVDRKRHSESPEGVTNSNKGLMFAWGEDSAICMVSGDYSRLLQIIFAVERQRQRQNHRREVIEKFTNSNKGLCSHGEKDSAICMVSGDYSRLLQIIVVVERQRQRQNRRRVNAASGSILTELVFFEDSLISSLRDCGRLMSREAFGDAPCSNELYMGFWEDRGLIP
ncbi:hypothetical protein CDAR_68701 [Caerostris darwini]|uniref:Uncharacterized protein n=1 Tax=Caerostris darwini TaxID=1538125 RepID=A0AAV4X093_9ARAC|nr:hypothetical protein CDAR_68701 [Caerostris darwini]